MKDIEKIKLETIQEGYEQLFISYFEDECSTTEHLPCKPYVPELCVSTPSNFKSTTNSGSTTMIIVGVSVGILVLIAIAIIFVCCRKKKKNGAIEGSTTVTGESKVAQTTKTAKKSKNTAGTGTATRGVTTGREMF